MERSSDLLHRRNGKGYEKSKRNQHINSLFLFPTHVQVLNSLCKISSFFYFLLLLFFNFVETGARVEPRLLSL